MNRTENSEGLSQRRLFRLLDDPRWRMLVAVIMSLIGWIVVTVGIQPGTDRTINHVPVDFNYDAGRYSVMGLSIVNDPSKTVSLKIYGNGSDIGGLKKEDFVVYPRYSSVKGPGQVDLSLDVKCTAENADSIRVNVLPADSEVRVVFDKIQEKTVPVRVVPKNVSVAEGYTLYKSTPVPGEVVLKGPASELDIISEAVVEVTAEGKLDHTETLSAPLSFVDEDGELVTPNYVKPEDTTADVMLTVYKQVELPLVVDLIHAPPGFDQGSLRYTLSQATLQVAGPSNVVDDLTELHIGTIDLSSFALDKVYEMPVELPNGLVTQENVSSVTVNFETADLTTKTFNLKAQDAVQIINLPSSYNLEVLSSRIRNVVLCGPKDVLNGLTAESVVARIDMDEMNIVTGQQNIAVNIYVPAENQVFALGSYSVSCQIESQ